VPTSSHIYSSPEDPLNGRISFKVNDCAIPRRFAARTAASAAEVEHVRASRHSTALQTLLRHENDFKGYFLPVAPSSEARVADQHQQHLCDTVATTAPYNTMYLGLLNVLPHLQNLFAVLNLVKKKKDKECIISTATMTRSASSWQEHDIRCHGHGPGL